MLIAVLAAVLSVASGAVLALVPGGSRTLGRIRTFALIAAAAVVAGHLLPEAVSAIGGRALLLMVVALALPELAERVILALERGPRGAGPGAPPPAHAEHGGHRRARGRLARELGFAGLVLHHLADGVALWTYGASGDVRPDIVITLAAHTVPVVAVMVLEFAGASGRRSALIRAAALLAAMIAGGLSAAVIAPAVITGAGPWIAAAVSGLLLHVIGHDLTADPPESTGERVADLLAAGAGLLLPLAAAPGAAEGAAEAGTADIGAAFGRALLAASPWLLGGLLLSTTLSRGRARPGPPSRSRLVQALGGALDALRCPVALPDALDASVAAANALDAPARGSALLLAAPAAGLDGALLQLGFLGAPLALGRLGAALLIAAAGALASTRTRGPRQAPSPAGQGPSAGAPAALARFEALLRHAGPWTIVGCFAAACLDAGRSDAPLPLGPLLVAAAIPAVTGYLSAIAAAPVAAALLAGSASPGLVVGVLLLGPVLSGGALARLDDLGGPRAGARAASACVALAAALALAVELFASARGPGALVGGTPHSAETMAALACPPAVALGATVVISGLALRGMWRLGPRGWIAGLHAPDRAHAAH